MLTYNLMLTTCTKLGQPQSALAVYDKMCADGVVPTTKTFTTLISAFSKVSLQQCRHLVLAS